MTERLARLLSDLAAQGVTFKADGGQIRVTGMDREAWLDDWLERNHSELLALLGNPRRVEAKRERLEVESADEGSEEFSANLAEKERGRPEDSDGNKPDQLGHVSPTRARTSPASGSPAADSQGFPHARADQPFGGAVVEPPKPGPTACGILRGQPRTLSSPTRAGQPGGCKSVKST